jgi:hypothetical protein
VEIKKKNAKTRKKYCCGGAEESKGSDGDAAATVAHAVKGGEKYCCDGEPSAYCCSGTEKSEGGDATALVNVAAASPPNPFLSSAPPHENTLDAPTGATACGNEAAGSSSFSSSLPVGAPSAAAAKLYGE